MPQTTAAPDPTLVPVEDRGERAPEAAIALCLSGLRCARP